MTALAVRNLSKTYGGVRALQSVTLSVERGERRVIIGPNGAGKTTLFHSISGATLPTSGMITLFETDITRLSPNVRAGLGLSRTFQVTNLFTKLTVLENVLLAVAGTAERSFGLIRPMTGYRHLYAKAQHLLEEWQLEDSAQRLVRHLSYGEQRQLELVLALAGSPKLLLLDEPTAGLSPAETGQVVAMVRRLPRDMTIVMIEHDMDVAFELADRITMLHQGRLIVEGDKAAIRADSQVNEIYLGTQ